MILWNNLEIILGLFKLLKGSNFFSLGEYIMYHLGYAFYKSLWNNRSVFWTTMLNYCSKIVVLQ